MQPDHSAIEDYVIKANRGLHKQLQCLQKRCFVLWECYLSFIPITERNLLTRSWSPDQSFWHANDLKVDGMTPVSGIGG